MNRKLLSMVTASLIVLALPSIAGETTRQQSVAERGSKVMPFSLEATTHVFTKTPVGGFQEVVAKASKDADQVRLTREHLSAVAKKFAAGDFSAPEKIHGQDMPGLSALKQAKRSDIKVTYTPIDAGGKITFASSDPSLVHALHAWFDAQLSDHGHDAMSGHDHMSMGEGKK